MQGRHQGGSSTNAIDEIAGIEELKKAHLLKTAPWLLAVLAPADVEGYRLPIPVAPFMKASFDRR